MFNSSLFVRFFSPAVVVRGVKHEMSLFDLELSIKCIVHIRESTIYGRAQRTKRNPSKLKIGFVVCRCVRVTRFCFCCFRCQKWYFPCVCVCESWLAKWQPSVCNCCQTVIYYYTVQYNSIWLFNGIVTQGKLLRFSFRFLLIVNCVRHNVISKCFFTVRHGVTLW